MVKTRRLLWGVVILLVMIAIAAVVRRFVVLFWPPQVNAGDPRAALDVGFARHRVLTLIHVACGFIFVVLGPLQFVGRIRSRRLRFHRWSGRLFIAAGLVIGVSALLMSFQTSIGGANETA